MNFEQAKEYSFLVPWKTMQCFSGPDCWCRMIVPIESIKYEEYYKNVGATIYREYDVIVDAAAIDEETAEYIVNLHNERLKNITEDPIRLKTVGKMKVKYSEGEQLKPVKIDEID